MDYLDAVAIVRHPSWRHSKLGGGNDAIGCVLFTTAATVSYLDYRYGPDDILLFGRELAGVPQDVHAAPMHGS